MLIHCTPSQRRAGLCTILRSEDLWTHRVGGVMFGFILLGFFGGLVGFFGWLVGLFRLFLCLFCLGCFATGEVVVDLECLSCTS